LDRRQTWNISADAEIFEKITRDTVAMHDELAATATLLSEPARAAILLKLLGGHAMPAGDLALAANISPQTASGHLAKLVKGKFINVERQGRHRYYRLVGPEVADAVEALLTVAAGKGHIAAGNTATPVVGTLAHARTCYAHLAGWLGVQIAAALQNRGLLLPAEDKAFAVTECGRSWFQDLGIAVPAGKERGSAKLAKQCLDWTERRPHLAGSLGIGMYKRFVALKWIVSIPNTRAVRVTIDGRRELWKLLRVPVG
jgi:DNA-binding transcriptional ArsR family regulator